MKKGFKFYIALWGAKVGTALLKLLRRNATFFPGKFALKVCPDFIEKIEKPKTIVAVTGTNGKTTVCNMIEDILKDNNYVFIDNKYGSNIDAGIATTLISGANFKGKSKKDLAILEVDERSSPKIYPYLTPTYLVCTNLFRDSLMRNAHTEFISGILTKYIPKATTLILNGDDKNCLDLAQETKASTIITYGISNQNANFYAEDIIFDNDGFPQFKVYKDNDLYCDIKLSVPGKHNVLNALACIALCDTYCIDKNVIKSALLKFTGAHRRFEFKGKVNGASIYDDYGHHPTEIIATAKALANKKYNQSWVVFQPHTYSRTKNLLDDFATALLNFDNILVLDIYAARESNTYNISSQDLVNRIKELGKTALYMPSFDECVNYLKSNVKNNDIVVTLGAGTVTEIGPLLINN